MKECLFKLNTSDRLRANPKNGIKVEVFLRQNRLRKECQVVIFVKEKNLHMNFFQILEPHQLNHTFVPPQS